MPMLAASRASRSDSTILILLIAGLIALGSMGGCGGDDDEPSATPCSTAGHPEDFLPQNVQGWIEMAGGRETASTIPELQATVVDGGFQPYEFYDFQEFVHTVYEGSVQGSPAALDVQITELASPEKALAMYNDTQYGIKPSTSEPVTPPVGDASRLARSIGTLTLDFVECAYWVKLYINDTSDDGLSILQAFAASIEQEIPQ